MKRVAFHSNQLGLRGTEVALYDYALYNETLLGNKSYIISDANAESTTYKKFHDRFEVFRYKNSFSECFDFVKSKLITHVYYIKAGENDGKLIPNVTNAVHAVFQKKDVHGDRYAYVSEWLSRKMNMPESYIPHIVKLPTPTQTYRNELNISKDAIVIGRHGGFNEFDVPFVYQAIYDVLSKRDDVVFLFMNTRQFGPSHPKILFVNGTYNLQNKSNFIETCDYMIHARNHGESFGLAICEFLHGGKPVISWTGGLDQHHTMLLKDTSYMFNNLNELNNILLTLKADNNPDIYKSIVQKFSPIDVMSRFESLFLS